MQVLGNSMAGLCAVVVTYHPDSDTMQNLAATRRQLSQMVVVDNGSSAAEIEMLQQAAAQIGFELIANGENLGIATALNQGVRWAAAQGCGFVMLFDQDSSVTDAYVAAMLDCFQSNPLADKLAILVPRYIDRRFGSVLAPPERGGTLEAATTSGSLMPLSVFDRAGWFADELFIDGVDYEYSLRVRRLGYTIAECTAATLLHSPGTPAYHRLFGSKPFQAANYRPVRRYYQERNKVWVTKRYWRDFPSFCARQFVTSAKDFLKIVLVEEDKVRKCRSFLLGLWDGLLGRTGKMSRQP